VVDVAPGAGTGMSLEGLDDLHFVVTSPSAADRCSSTRPRVRPG